MPAESKDLGIEKLKKQLRKLGQLKVLVGVQGDQARAPHPNADASVGQVALWNHAGTEDSDGVTLIPKRPFVDQGISDIKGAKKEIKRAVSDLVDGRAKTPIAALKPVGDFAGLAIRKAIDSSRSWAAPLAQSTIDKKGHSQPLIDSGTVRDSVTYTVRDGDKILAEGGAS